jgi:hypothetical protein
VDGKQFDDALRPDRGSPRRPRSRSQQRGLGTMPPLLRPHRIHPFEVVLQASGAAAAEVLRSAPDPDRATLAFHLERQRLTEHQVAGELQLRVHHDDEPRTLLWERLG